MLESRLTSSLVAKLPQRSSLAVCELCDASKEHCKQGYGRVCAKLKQIRMITAICMGVASFPGPAQLSVTHGESLGTRLVWELSGPTFYSLCKNLAWWAVTQRTSQNHNCQNWGVDTYVGMGVCPGQYCVLVNQLMHLT